LIYHQKFFVSPKVKQTQTKPKKISIPRTIEQEMNEKKKEEKRTK